MELSALERLKIPPYTYNEGNGVTFVFEKLIRFLELMVNDD